LLQLLLLLQLPRSNCLTHYCPHKHTHHPAQKAIPNKLHSQAGTSLALSTLLYTVARLLLLQLLLLLLALGDW
jgi:hypothetical protein